VILTSCNKILLNLNTDLSLLHLLECKYSKDKNIKINLIFKIIKIIYYFEIKIITLINKNKFL